MFSKLEKDGVLKIKGKTIRLESVTTLEKGKKIVYATDTRPSNNTVKAALGADVLIHEAAYSNSEKSLAVQRKHATAQEAALVAKKARVKLLVLTHISARHRSPEILEKEAKKIFRNTKIAYDGLRIKID